MITSSTEFPFLGSFACSLTAKLGSQITAAILWIKVYAKMINIVTPSATSHGSYFQKLELVTDIEIIANTIIVAQNNA